MASCHTSANVFVVPYWSIHIYLHGLVVSEIEERRAFLEQMEALGQGGVYRTQIRTEISQRVRMLEVIDQKRSADLAALEAQQDK